MDRKLIFLSVFLLALCFHRANCGFRFRHHSVSSASGDASGFSISSSGNGVASGFSSSSSGGGRAITVKARFSISRMVFNIIKLPLTIITNVFKVPLKIISGVIELIITLINHIQVIGADVVSQIIALVKQIIAKVVEILVEVGVLQGKTVEEIVDSIIKIISSAVQFALNAEMKISSYIVDTMVNIFDGLNIKGIVKRITSLPIVKQIVDLVLSIRSFIHNNFQAQIKDIQLLIYTQFEEHKDFFQPILDAISSRILIISNALHALVNGDLKQCPGGVNPSSSPTGSLQWQLNILIDKCRVRILKLLGMTGLAASTQAKLNEIASRPPAGPIASLPPVVGTLMADQS